MNARTLLILPPLALGLLGYIWMTSPDETSPESGEEVSVAVRVVQVSPRSITPSVTGFGRVTAEREWSAVAELSGAVTSLAEGIAIGSIVEEGMLIAELDRSSYELARARARASVADAEAQLEQLVQEEDNTRRSLEIERRSLTVARKEFSRIEQLVERGASSDAALDNARRLLLAQEMRVAELTNTLRLFPSRRNAIAAIRKIQGVELAAAELALERTRFFVPFRGRVTALNVQIGQFARNGETLISLDSLDAAEITAELQPRALRPLISTTALALSGTEALQADAGSNVELLRDAGVSVTVTEPGDDDDDIWSAEIVRFRGAVDAETGSIGIVVRVDEPTRLDFGVRSGPLNTGGFVAVTFHGASVEDAIAIPRSAVQHSETDAFVYVANAQGRLEIREIVTGSVLGDLILVESGLAGGETLVLSEPRPPIPGMLLDLVPENESTATAITSESDH